LARILTNGAGTVTLTVPVNDVPTHMVTAVEQGYEWFDWENVVYNADKDIVQATLRYPRDGDESDIVEMTFTDVDFLNGLQKFLSKHPRGTTEVIYQGDGDWDIDANGADAIVQFAVYGECIFS